SNTNPGYATAPMAVWVVSKNIVADNTKVFDAANLNSAPYSLYLVTVMSAEPFTIRTKTDGPMVMLSTLTGFDAIANENDDCTNVVVKMDDGALSDVQAVVQSPLITFFYDDREDTTMTSLSAHVGKDTTLDFSGISFFASPGYIGCKDQKTFRSSLYDATTSVTYASLTRSYDVAVSSILATDADHGVKITDWTGSETYTWNDPRSYTFTQTSNLEISWTRNEANLDEAFLVTVTPSNEHIHTTIGPDATTGVTTGAPLERTTTDSITPEITTTQDVDDRTDTVPEATTTGSEPDDHITEEPSHSTTQKPDGNTDEASNHTTTNSDTDDHTDEEPMSSTTQGSDDRTDDVPEHTTANSGAGGYTN
ncbi:hypothetical protein PENTCL1PPCAC_21178, partial [Pristionchus entomophagus]